MELQDKLDLGLSMLSSSSSSSSSCSSSSASSSSLSLSLSSLSKPGSSKRSKSSSRLSRSEIRSIPAHQTDVSLQQATARMNLLSSSSSSIAAAVSSSMSSIESPRGTSYRRSGSTTLSPTSPGKSASSPDSYGKLTSPFKRNTNKDPSSRRLFQEHTPSAADSPADQRITSPSPSPLQEAHTPTFPGSAHDFEEQDVFGKIDHTPLRQETHSTSPLPNSRSFQTGDMLDDPLYPLQTQRLSVGNIIAPERSSSRKPPKRLPTDPEALTASPTPGPKAPARFRTMLSPMSSSGSQSSLRHSLASASSSTLDTLHEPTEDLSESTRHRMACLQQSPSTYY
ncbi:hypothetical protein BCV70DRAFT_214065 [Testicularia cyperi]|uniref:Uncharacterized protein n=1 Tax=Testicularia cyperi TaxID=1882483 RepID=A0A317XYZ4_9BASI|nr:hypothetical protein BCV70DRAFT_214065 [Testicularia cyperi]